MDVLLVGAGGREHAIAWKFKRSPLLDTLWVWPNHPALGKIAKSLPVSQQASLRDVVSTAKSSGVDLVVVGPEGPLDQGIADLCHEFGLAVFGPDQQLAALESSKAFAKNLMERANVPTAAFKVVNDRTSCEKIARQWLNEKGGVVIKASGLASGKGVFVCTSDADIDAAIKMLFEGSFSAAAATVVLEEILEGRECSFFCFIGSGGVTPLGFAVDFKRLQDEDKGPNTGGMGCYSPVPWLPDNADRLVLDTIVEPLLALMSKDYNKTYTGCLYVGIMWGVSGPRVVEFNVRLGDPEAQVLALQDESDWLELIASKAGLAVPGASVDMISRPPASKERRSVAVVLASSNYPYGLGELSVKEFEGSIFQNADSDNALFGASVLPMGGGFETGAGRVLTVVSSAGSFSEARQSVYERVEQLTNGWQGVQYRRDIAGRVES